MMSGVDFQGSNPELPSEASPQRGPWIKVARIALNVAGWVITLAAAVVLLAIISFMVAPKLLNMQGLVVLSGSMEPEIQTGGIVLIKPVDTADVRVGDIITFGERRVGTTHRVVEILHAESGLMFRTKGDANQEADLDLVPAGSVRGRVALDVPYVGRVIDALKDRANFYLFIGVPAALLVINELVNIARELRNPNTSNTSTRKEVSA